MHAQQPSGHETHSSELTLWSCQTDETRPRRLTRVVSDISPDTWVHVFDTDHERVVPRQCGCEERAADTFAGVNSTLNHADPLENYSARSQQSSLAAMLECLMLVDGGVRKISFGHDFAIELDPRGMAFNRHWATGHCHCGNA